MTSGLWLATWETGPVLAVRLRVAIDVDEGTIASIRVKGWERDSVHVEGGGQPDWAVVAPWLEGLVGLEWSDTGCVEADDGDEMAWAEVHVDEIRILEDRLRVSAEQVREQRKLANPDTK